MKLKVFKFGGASVKDADGVRNVAGIVSSFGEKAGLVLVVSAMGKTTNALERILKMAIGRLDFSSEVKLLADAHYRTAEALFTDASERHHVYAGLQGYFEELQLMLGRAGDTDPDFLYDQVVSMGEYLSSFLLFSYLRSNAFPLSLVDASTVIRTSDNWKEGEVLTDDSALLVEKYVKPLLSGGNVLLQGFIGGTADGLKTTLGREGSDYTAALMAYFLDAESVTIWKDVPGVLSADPAWKPDAVLLPELSYQDAAELTYYGATVIHPKTIRPLARKKIPLYVRSFLKPDGAGTIVGPDLKKQRQESWIRKKEQVLVSLSSRDFSFMEEHNIREVLQAFSDAGLKMQMLQVSATSISVVTDGEDRRLERAFDKIGQQYAVLFNRDLTLITIQNPGEDARNFRLEGKMPVLIQQTRSTVQLLFSAE